MALGQVIDRFLAFTTRYGANPTESEDERVLRLIWSTTILLAMPTTLGIGMAFAILGSQIGATILFVAAAFWLAEFVLFGLVRRGLNTFALVSQLSTVLVSFAATVSLGGPIRSGGLVFLGLIGPLYAVVFPRPRRAVLVFVAYFISLAADVWLTGRITWAQPLPPRANLIFFVAMLVSVMIFPFVTLAFFVRERNRALALLREAQEKISRLLQSAPKASESIPHWSRSLAAEIAATVGADAIGIWELERDNLTPVSDGGLRPPSIEELKGLMAGAGWSPTKSERRTLVPVTCMSGELCGALVLSGRGLTLGETERRLIAGFAHQLGATLDVSRIRKQLAVAEERRAARRREMNARGIATLQICPRCSRCFDDSVTECEGDGVRLESPRTLPYRLMGRYRFLHVLGQGGMGTVLAACDEKLDRDVAVKLIRPEHFNNPGLMQRFEREARTIARIQHPGVIAVYDSGETEDGAAFLVMELLKGSSLASLIGRYGRGTPAQVAALVRQGAAALAAAHQAGVIHRDIKPENIILAEDASGFRAKVLDFGIAKTIAIEKGLTQTGMVIGTPAYMSPEQVRGEEVDSRSDLYSFAAVCYEALTGQRAVAGGDFGQVLINVLSTPPIAVSRLLPGIPAEVDRAFASALAKARVERQKDIEEWGQSFAEVLERQSPDPQAAGWPVPLDGRPHTGRDSSSEADTVEPGERPTVVS